MALLWSFDGGGYGRVVVVVAVVPGCVVDSSSSHREVAALDWESWLLAFLLVFGGAAWMGQAQATLPASSDCYIAPDGLTYNDCASVYTDVPGCGGVQRINGSYKGAHGIGGSVTGFPGGADACNASTTIVCNTTGCFTYLLPGTCTANASYSGGACNCNSGYEESSDQLFCVVAQADCTDGALVNAVSGFANLGITLPGVNSWCYTSTTGAVNTAVSFLTASGLSSQLVAIPRLVNGVTNYFVSADVVRRCVAGNSHPTIVACTSEPVLTLAASLPAETCGTGGVLVNNPNGSKSCVNSTTGLVVNPNSAVAVTTTMAGTTPAGAVGAITNTIVVSNPDGSTTTTNRDAAGNVVSVVTTASASPTTGDAFCTANPSSPLCVSSGWGGTCGNYSCSGDAVECAIARAAYSERCDALSASTAAVGTGVLSNPTGDAAAEKAALSSTVSLPSSFDQTDLLSGGACPNDLTAAMPGWAGGGNISFSFSWLCSFAALVRAIVIASSLLFGAVIVVKGL